MFVKESGFYTEKFVSINNIKIIILYSRGKNENIDIR